MRVEFPYHDVGRRVTAQRRGRRIGLTGFCMGDKYTILATCSCRGISAAVPWYGMLHLDS